MEYFNLANANILVVDDQVTNLQIINEVLKEHYNVFVARSGEAALAHCYKNPPDIILLDVNMPGLSGLDVCQTLKRDPLYQAIPIIFITALQGAQDENACWDSGAVDFVRKPINEATLLNRVKAHLTLKFQADALRRSALLDGLTNVYNRRYFEQQIEVEWQRCFQHNVPFAVVMLDVDHFKSYNDSYGHLMGDDCLKAIAQTLNECVPNERSFLARYGGEEFVMVLVGLSESKVQQLTELCMSSVRALGIPHGADGAKDTVTLSIGCCLSIQNGASSILSEMIANADKYLYQAKERGRDRAVVDAVVQ